MDNKRYSIVTNGLLSKWGFNEGSFLYNEEKLLISGADNKKLLENIVRSYVLPKINQEIELVVLNTGHNPVRASHVNGVEIDWMDNDQPDLITPEIVFISLEELAKEVNLCGGKLLVLDEQGDEFVHWVE